MLLTLYPLVLKANTKIEPFNNIYAHLARGGGHIEPHIC